MTQETVLNQQHTTRGTLALQKISELDVAFSSMSIWCQHRDSDARTNLAWTNGKTVYYGPGFSELILDEQRGVAVHEIFHIALRHISRGKALHARFGADYRHKIFNIATDAIINETLTAAGYKLPKPNIMLVELFKDVFNEEIKPEEAISEWDAEKLYLRLMSLKTPPQKGGGAGKGNPGKTSGPKGKSQPAPGQDQTAPGGKAEPDQPRLDADAIRRIIEDWADERGFIGDFEIDGEVGPDEASEDGEWQQRLARAIDMARLAGKGIGKLGHRIGDIPVSRTPWEVILRTTVTKAVTRSPRPSMERPTRRWLAMEFGGSTP